MLRLIGEDALQCVHYLLQYTPLVNMGMGRELVDYYRIVLR